MKKIIYNIKYIIYRLLGLPKLPKCSTLYSVINGATLFHNEYISKDQFVNLSHRYRHIDKSPIIRVSFPWDGNQRSMFNNTLTYLIECKFEPLVLFDCYYSDNTMIERMDYLKRNFPSIKYFELFNELPHMSYPGQQILNQDELIIKINEYTRLLKLKFPGSKIISMAPANSLHNIDHNSKYWKTNQIQLERLIKETDCDIIGLHCYVSSKKHEFNFKYLINNLKKWNVNNKDIWITETGIDKWSGHIKYFDEWISRFNQYIPNVKKVLWYRQSIDQMKSVDSRYALECRLENVYSPLFNMLDSELGQSWKRNREKEML